MIARYIGLAALATLSIGLHAQRNAVLGVRTGNGHHGARMGTLPVNDQCNMVTAEALSVGSTLNFNGTTEGATINGDYTDGSIMFSFGVPSVWHAFTTTACSNVRIDYCGSASVFSDYWNVLSLDCPATDNLVISPVYNSTDCVDGNPTIYFNDLPPGTYYFPVWCDVNTANGPYTLHVSAAACASGGPANDLCSGTTVQDLIVGHPLMITGDNTGATDSEGLGYPNVWEAFTTSECANVTLDYCGTDPRFLAFAEGLMSACPAVNTIAPTTTTGCDDGQLVEHFDLLQPGTYYIPVRMDANGSVGPYQISLNADPCDVVPPPSTDRCDHVSPEDLSPDTPLTFSGDNTGATSTDDAQLGSPLENLALVWHAFNLPHCADVTVDYCGTQNVPDAVLDVLSTECPSNTLIHASTHNADCPDGNSSFSFMHLDPGTYYIPVLSASGSMGPYTIDVQATDCVSTPANDECDGAVPLDVNVTCVLTTGSVTGATASLPAIDCNGTGVGSGHADLWYSFPAAQPGENVHVQGHDIDAVVEVFQDDCNALTSIACSDMGSVGDAEDLTLTGLTPGMTYHIRVYDRGDGLPADPTFGICVYGDIGTGIAQNSAPAFTLFPNPGNGDITLTRSGASGNVTIDLFDMTGRKVLSQGVYMARGEQRSFQWSGRLAPGAYSVRMTGADGTSQQRLTVK